MSDLTDLTLVEAAGRLQHRNVSALELMEATLQRIQETEPLIHAFAWLDTEQAIAAAREADSNLSTKRRARILEGVPIGVKDLLFTAGIPTEAGSRVLSGFRPTFDATVVTKLREAGAIIIGKTVTHEFAYGQNVPETRNPWQLESYPGGSSAGSGAAVAARALPGAIGTDTGGSIRTPAAVNGIVGMKATYGRVSRHGCIPMSSSLDHIGPLTRTVEDSAVMLQVLSGHDAKDPGSLKASVPDFRADISGGVKDIKIGLDRGYFLYELVQPAVRAAIEQALIELTSLGAEIVDISIPELDWSTTVGNVTTEVDISTWHRRFMRTKPQEYHPGTRLMLQLGELIPATHYGLVQQVRSRIQNAIKRTFLDYRLDCLIGPTIPVTAPRLDQLSVDLVDESAEGALSTLVHHEYPANVTGLPALSVPCGFSDAGLPIGLQIIGRPLDEAKLFRIGRAYEAVTEWHQRKPNLSSRSAAIGR